MEYLRKFLRLPTAERWLLIKSTLLLEAIKLGMWLLPFRVLRRLLAQVSETPSKLRHADRHSADRIAWAVEIASQHTPGVKTCLNQALATQVLLARRDYPSFLHIGVAKGEQGEFKAHAWVESEGKIVIGGGQLESFTPLTVLKGEMP